MSSASDGTPRVASYQRTTKESSVSVTINLDGSGKTSIEVANGMLAHMLDALARHAGFDLSVRAEGDVSPGWHHLIEDTAIALGRCVDRALDDRAGIARMGHAYVPLDEALARVVVDLGGRGYAVVDVSGPDQEGLFPSDLVRHFLEAFAIEARMNLHATVLAGANDHHRTEATFKALARALRAAVRRDPARAGQVPSTKGVIG